MNVAEAPAGIKFEDAQRRRSSCMASTSSRLARSPRISAPSASRNLSWQGYFGRSVRLRRAKPVSISEGDRTLMFKSRIAMRSESSDMRVRKKISGTTERPGSTFTEATPTSTPGSSDDAKGMTLVAASTVEKDLAAQIGEMDKKAPSCRSAKTIAERAEAAGIKTVVFDRGGYISPRPCGRNRSLASRGRSGLLNQRNARMQRNERLAN